ncbi:MAG: UDP-N-acetylglucosamine 2-epimerase [Candidatus Pacearchaeota archaeon]|jgi:hypothetical protein
MKKVMIIKKENIFPEWKAFKKINKSIWKIILNKIIKISKEENLLIIADAETKLELNLHGVLAKSFGDYIFEYTNTYKIANDFAKKIIKNLSIGEKGFLGEEEFSYTLIDYFENLILLENIKKTENPKGVYFLDSKFGNFVNLIFNKDSKKIISIKGMQNFIERFVKNFEFAARFYDLPLIKRIEFVKTGNLLKEKKKKRILILGFDELYYSRIENLVKEIIKQRREECIVLATNKDMQEKLRNKRINFVSFGDYLEKEDLGEVKKFSKEFTRKFNKKDFPKETFFYKKYDLSEIIKKDLLYFLKKRLPWIALYERCYDNLYKKERIDYVVGMDDVIPVTRTAVVSGKKNRVKTLLFQNGVSEDPCGRGYIPLIADKIAVWGEETKRYLENFGVADDRISITGNMRLVKPKIEISKEELYKKLGILNETSLIIVATSEFGGFFGEKEKEQFLRACIETAKRIPEKTFILKIHPREKPTLHYSLLKEIDAKNVRIVYDLNISDLINYSEGLIAIFSTTILDSMFLGKNSISVNLLNRPEIVPYTKYNSVVSVKNKKDLKKAILSLKNKDLKKGIKNFLGAYCYKTDGNESKRILEVLRKLK